MHLEELLGRRRVRCSLQTLAKDRIVIEAIDHPDPREIDVEATSP